MKNRSWSALTLLVTGIAASATSQAHSGHSQTQSLPRLNSVTVQAAVRCSAGGPIVDEIEAIVIEVEGSREAHLSFRENQHLSPSYDPRTGELSLFGAGLYGAIQVGTLGFGNFDCSRESEGQINVLQLALNPSPHVKLSFSRDVRPCSSYLSILGRTGSIADIFYRVSWKDTLTIRQGGVKTEISDQHVLDRFGDRDTCERHRGESGELPIPLPEA